MSDTVGFIGLGIMGRPMAANLAKNVAVLAYDQDVGRAADISNVSVGKSVADIGRRCSVVLMSLPGTAIVESIVTGPGGLLESLSPGSLIIDLSTTLPTASGKLAELALARQIDFVDAPVSGGESGAIEGTLSIMAGGKKTAFDRAHVYLTAISRSVVHLGGVGSGGVAKLVNNMIVGAEFAVIAEGFALAARFGLAADDLYQAIRGGWAASKVLDVSAAAMIEQDYRPGGTVDMIEKDIGYARVLATENRVPLPVTAATHEVYVAAQARGDGKLSQPAIIHLWESLMEVGAERRKGEPS
ncbi:MAG TPA: NAD(P)-binding domain-containing protein [Spirochaetia bacterium]|nr:NAD(P)-binding domain-containing protein [Spirochaetia bacterium]